MASFLLVLTTLKLKLSVLLQPQRSLSVLSFSLSSHLRLNGFLSIFWTVNGGCMGGWLPGAARYLVLKRRRNIFGIMLYVLKSFWKATLFPLRDHCGTVECYICKGPSSQPFQLPTLQVKERRPEAINELPKVT